MSNPEPTIRVNVDVTNPGQFFACCGLLELADRLWPEAEGWFEDSKFFVSANDGDALFAQLVASRLIAHDSQAERALRPIRLDAFDFRLDWWVDQRGHKTQLKLWAGQQTSLGIVTALQAALSTTGDEPLEHLFDTATPLTGRFGVDPRAAWEALDVGFSPNTQSMEVTTYPAVELLAAVGLQGFRPVPAQSGAYIYATWNVPLMAPVARAAGAGLISVGRVTRYRFATARRGSYKGFDYAIRTGDDT